MQNGSCDTLSSSSLIMAIRHGSHPHFGVQFHPESVCTTYGLQLLDNFRHITAERLNLQIRCEGLAERWQRGGSGCMQHYPFMSVLHTYLHMHACRPLMQLPASCLHLAPHLNSLPAKPSPAPASAASTATLSLVWGRLPNALPSVPGGSETIFEHLYQWEPDTFWLDR